MENYRTERVKRLCQALKGLTNGQLDLVEVVVAQFSKPFILIERSETSDIVNDCLLQYMGDALRIHHSFSKEPLSKDKFEYAFERTSNMCGARAQLAPKGNPGHDITVNGTRMSLKTQADKNISENKIHISKFMELGKGEWGNSIAHLDGLRSQFLQHMKSYDRILSLRCLSRKPRQVRYELVEIPKTLLQEARGGSLRIQTNSSQSPKPGYCDVMAAQGKMKFQLYFDGGTERKLQIKNLLKEYCIVHATWVFSTEGQR
jgi:hypothetical protein